MDKFKLINYFQTVRRGAEKILKIILRALLKMPYFCSSIGKKISRFLSRQKKAVAYLFWLVSLYLIGIVGLSLAIYVGKINTPAIQSLLALYPMPAAIVGLDFVPAKIYLRRLEFATNYGLTTGQGIGSPKEISDQVLEQLIGDSIVVTQGRIMSISPLSQSIDKVFEDISAKNGGKEEVEKVLYNLYGMNQDEFKQLIKIQLIKDEIVQNQLEQIKIKHILLPDENQATETIKKLQEGKDFSALAKELSRDDKSRDNGGELDWAGHGGLIKELEEVSFKLKVGELYSQPVKSEYGYHVIALVDKKGNIPTSYNDWLEQKKKESFILKFIKYRK